MILKKKSKNLLYRHYMRSFQFGYFGAAYGSDKIYVIYETILFMHVCVCVCVGKVADFDLFTDFFFIF